MGPLLPDDLLLFPGKADRDLDFVLGELEHSLPAASELSALLEDELDRSLDPNVRRILQLAVGTPSIARRSLVNELASLGLGSLGFF